MIFPDRALTLRFSQPAEVGEIVGLDAVEIVFRLSVDHAEDGIGVGFTLDVCDAPVISCDRYFPRRSGSREYEYEQGGEERKKMPLRVLHIRRRGGAARPLPRVSAQCARSTRGRGRRIIGHTESWGAFNEKSGHGAGNCTALRRSHIRGCASF